MPAGRLSVRELEHPCPVRSDAFDAVYGSSAGAINATYFLSGQRDGVNIYTTEIANERFIDLRRLLHRGKGEALVPRLY